MLYDYSQDKYGVACLEQANLGKGRLGFGAVLVGDLGEILTSGRNRKAYDEDRGVLPDVDYAIHAEQDCVLQAIKKGYDVRGLTVYVLGTALSGRNKGALTTRTEETFGCRKCPKTFIQYDISIMIPMVTGWKKLTPHQAMATGKEFHGNGTWAKFVNGEVAI